MSTLVVLAAGMGSRFGGLKQLCSVGNNGKTLLDYTVYDARQVGFDRVVFVVRQDMLDDFRYLVGDRISRYINCRYVIQGNGGVTDRIKPLGTAHALLCCKGAVDEPFAVVNADDFYGRNALGLACKHLKTARPFEYAMVGYELGNTLSRNGYVSRGVCNVANGLLTSVCETHNIDGDCIVHGDKDVRLPSNTVVSMNLWAFTPDVFDLLDEYYKRFCMTADLTKDEYQLPTAVSLAVSESQAAVRVYQTADKWYGLTYRQDLDEVRRELKDLDKEYNS